MRKILVVDDDRQIREIYRRVLEIEGYPTAEAGDWEAVTEALLEHPDIGLILLDIHMPDVSGDVVYRVARLHDPHIRVIVSSVYPLDEQKRIILKADDYFDKSEGTGLLVRKVRQVLSQPVSTAATEVTE